MAIATAPGRTFEGPVTDQVSRTRTLWAAIKRKPLGMVSAVLIVVLVLTAIFANVLAPYDPLAAQPEIRLAPPSWAHPFGTDDIGRDVLSRVIYGSRISLWVGLLAVGIGTCVGMIVGLVSGYWEGRLDLMLQRVMDALMTIPGLILALAIAMVIIPGNSRVVRGAVLSAKQNRFVEAAQAIGCRLPDHRLAHPAQRDGAHPHPRLHLAGQRHPDRSLVELPRGRDAAAHAFVGTDAVQHGAGFMEQAPWLAFFPGLAISLAVFGFNLFGDTLRDAWDPKLRRQG